MATHAAKRAKLAFPADEPFVQAPARYAHANECIRLRFVGRDGQVSHGVAPDFTHQIFENESLELPPEQRPLTIEVFYSAITLEVFVQCDREMEGAVEDAMFQLAGALPGMRASMEELTRCAAQPMSAESAAELFGGAVKEFGEATGGATRSVCTPAAPTEAPLIDEPLSSAAAGSGSSTVCAGASRDASSTFTLHCGTLHDSPGRAELCTRLQSLFRWYIEGRSPIDESDSRWRLFSLLERRAGAGTPAYALAGACTCFVFTRWAAGAAGAAGPRRVVRICQALVLPQYQGRGLGTRLLQAIYDWARAEGVVEITVEDPSPKFRLLRDLVDTRLCISRELLAPPSVAASCTEEALDEAQAALLLTREQLVRCYEAQQYHSLVEQCARAHEATHAALQKPFRLQAKRRLNKKHVEALDAAAMAAEAEGADGSGARKGMLERLYQAAPTPIPPLRKALIRPYGAHRPFSGAHLRV